MRVESWELRIENWGLGDRDFKSENFKSQINAENRVLRASMLDLPPEDLRSADFRSQIPMLMIRPESRLICRIWPCQQLRAARPGIPSGFVLRSDHREGGPPRLAESIGIRPQHNENPDPQRTRLRNGFRGQRCRLPPTTCSPRCSQLASPHPLVPDHSPLSPTAPYASPRSGVWPEARPGVLARVAPPRPGLARRNRRC